VDPDSNGARQRSAVSGGRGRRLHVSVTDGRGRPVRDGGLARWLSHTAPAAARGAVAIALVTDAHSQKLNSQYRRKNTPTDVLSFPPVSASANRGHSPDRAPRIADPAPGIADPDARGFLGDIVIATGTAQKQARAAGHSYQAELRVLALHGLLHLLGYDHETADDAGRMRRLETRLRRRGGLAAGLIERA
jgi:probable rRNA maturation factor